jgi:hypothetical protein
MILNKNIKLNFKTILSFCLLSVLILLFVSYEFFYLRNLYRSVWQDTFFLYPVLIKTLSFYENFFSFSSYLTEQNSYDQLHLNYFYNLYLSFFGNMNSIQDILPFSKQIIFFNKILISVIIYFFCLSASRSLIASFILSFLAFFNISFVKMTTFFPVGISFSSLIFFLIGFCYYLENKKENFFYYLLFGALLSVTATINFLLILPTLVFVIFIGYNKKKFYFLLKVFFILIIIIFIFNFFNIISLQDYKRFGINQPNFLVNSPKIFEHDLLSLFNISDLLINPNLGILGVNFIGISVILFFILCICNRKIFLNKQFQYFLILFAICLLIQIKELKLYYILSYVPILSSLRHLSAYANIMIISYFFLIIIYIKEVKNRNNITLINLFLVFFLIENSLYYLNKIKYKDPNIYGYSSKNSIYNDIDNLAKKIKDKNLVFIDIETKKVKNLTQKNYFAGSVLIVNNKKNYQYYHSPARKDIFEIGQKLNNSKNKNIFYDYFDYILTDKPQLDLNLIEQINNLYLYQNKKSLSINSICSKNLIQCNYNSNNNISILNKSDENVYFNIIKTKNFDILNKNVKLNNLKIFNSIKIAPYEEIILTYNKNILILIYYFFLFIIFVLLLLLKKKLYYLIK